MIHGEEIFEEMFEEIFEEIFCVVGFGVDTPPPQATPAHYNPLT
jgi:hypothetical protein